MVGVTGIEGTDGTEGIDGTTIEGVIGTEGTEGTEGVTGAGATPCWHFPLTRENPSLLEQTLQATPPSLYVKG